MSGSVDLNNTAGSASASQTLAPPPKRGRDRPGKNLPPLAHTRPADPDTPTVGGVAPDTHIPAPVPKLHKKCTALEKRKVLDEETERTREEHHKELYNAMKSWVSDLQKDKAELNEKLVEKEDELEKAHKKFLEDIHTRDNEILRLKKLLAEKAGNNNSTATGLLDLTPEAILQNSTPMSPKRMTPLSYGKVKRVQLSENAPQSSPAQESQELEECSRRHTCISGSRANETQSARMLGLLLQSLLRMKISVNDETEMFSISVSHEASGYSFILTWLEKSDEWSYKLSSLGTLERIATDWMRQDLRFSMTMCRMFFERIASIIAKGGQHALR